MLIVIPENRAISVRTSATISNQPPNLLFKFLARAISPSQLSKMAAIWKLKAPNSEEEKWPREKKNPESMPKLRLKKVIWFGVRGVFKKTAVKGDDKKRFNLKLSGDPEEFIF